MSSTLAFEPIMPRKYKTLGDELKYILTEKFTLNDGRSRLNESHIPYLEGLADAGMKDAKILIDNIKKYGEIDLFLEY